MTLIDTEMKPKNEPTLWRVNVIRDIKFFDYIKTKKEIGMGWATKTATKDLKAFLAEAKSTFQNPKDYSRCKRALNRFALKMKIDDLCWTRDPGPNGSYYLLRIIGDWEHTTDCYHIAADLVNIRKSIWLPVGPVGAVPGAVANSFSRGGTIQRICDPSALQYSKLIWNGQQPQQAYPLEPGGLDILNLVSHEDLEDIVGLYLQAQGWLMIPSTAKGKNTKAHEYQLIHRTSQNGALVQVKTKENINAQSILHDGLELFLFTMGQVHGLSKRVTVISPAKIKAFIIENPSLQSPRVKEWMKYFELQN